MCAIWSFVSPPSSPGIAGGLGTINYEIVTAENVGVVASGNVLIMSFVGGVGHFFGPVIGAMLVSFLQSALSSYTQAWLLYFGLFFVVMILFAPGGIASLIMLHLPAARNGLLPRLIPSYVISGAALAVVLGGFITLVEMTYHLEMGEELGKSFKLFGAGRRRNRGRVVAGCRVRCSWWGSGCLRQRSNWFGAAGTASMPSLQTRGAA